MKTKIVLIGILTLLCAMFFVSPTMATVTPTSPLPADGATGVPDYTNAFTVTLTSSNMSLMNGTIYCVQTAETRTLTEIANGTHALNFSSLLSPLIVHQIWVNVSDGTGDWKADAWVNTSYNFTTGGVSRMRNAEGVPTWAGSLFIVITILVFAMLIWRDISSGISNKGKFDKDAIKRLMIYLVAIIVLSVALTFL